MRRRAGESFVELYLCVDCWMLVYESDMATIAHDSPSGLRVYRKTCSAKCCLCHSQAACVDILDAICGADDANLNFTRLPEYFVNTPAGAQYRVCVRPMDSFV